VAAAIAIPLAQAWSKFVSRKAELAAAVASYGARGLPVPVEVLNPPGESFGAGVATGGAAVLVALVAAWFVWGKR
jgi:hypothetical protein